MIVFGITGGIGSGKSVVSRLAEMMGILVYYADDESKQLLNSSQALKDALCEAFGSKLYINGQIDKKLFASIIFTDSKKLQQANEIIHPFVKNHFLSWIEEQRQAGKKIVAAEAAILYESGFNKFVDKVILVCAPVELRIQRAVARDKAYEAEITARIKHQKSDNEKIELADYIVTNDNKASLISQVRQIFDPILQENRSSL